MSAAAETLERALEHHHAGELDRAEALYRDVLRIDPAHAEALHLLGVAEHQRDRNDTAADYIARAIAVNASAALFHSNLGACHRALGRVEEAIACFREAIRLDPDFAGAHYNLAMALEADGQVDAAVEAYRETIRLDPDFIDAWNNLGNLYSAQQDYAQAIECFRHIIAQIPEFAGIHYNLANALADNGQLHEALEAYRQAISLQPGLVEAHNNLGAILKELGRLDEAAACFEKAIELNPDYTEAQFNLANVCRINTQSEATVEQLEEAVRRSPNSAELHAALGKALEDAERFEEAAESYQRAIDLDPQHAKAHFGLGFACLSQGRHTEARQCYERGLVLDRTNASAWNNLGSIYNSDDDLDEALTCFETAAALDPQNAKVHFNIGNIHKERWNYAEAEAAYRRAIERDPQLADPQINLGVLLQNQGQVDDAIEAFSRAVSLDAQGSGAHFHRSLARLLKGDFAEGWREYEWRWKYYNTDRGFTAPVWDGSPLGDETLLIYGEQGVGDELMFASCLGDVLGRAAACIVECDERLVPLFARSFPLARVIGRRTDAQVSAAAPLPHFDLQIPAGGLPGYVRNRFDAFPRHRRYLVPDARALAKWKAQYARLGSGLKVGISWRGGHDPKIRRRRSTRLEQWKPVLSLPGIQFINLQYGDCADELQIVRQSMGVTIHDWKDADPLADLDDFAAQVAALDLVISTDNATVHMAGAVGTRVWTLLPYAPNWRWMLDRDDTPWYACMRLIRQPSPNNWESVFQRVAGELAEQAAFRQPEQAAAEPDPADEPEETASAPPIGLSSLQTSILTAPLSGWDQRPAPAVEPQLNIDDMLDGAAPAAETPMTEIPSIVFDPEVSGAGNESGSFGLCWQEPDAVDPPPAATPITEPVVAEADAVREKQKYEKMWMVDSYRTFSPGLAAVDKFPFINRFRQLGVKTILDAGCGSGKLMQKLMTEHADEFQVHGFDISENCLDPFFDDIKDQVLTIGCLWNPDDFVDVYDAVICTDVLEHIPTEHVPRVLANLQRCTRKGCYLAIALVDDNFGRSVLGEPLHLTVKKPQWWFAQLTSAGFYVDGHALESDEKGRELVLHVFATPK